MVTRVKTDTNMVRPQKVYFYLVLFKEDFQSIGGHDPLYFNPQSKEDSDIFNRFLLNGHELIQTWDGMFII